MVAPVHKLLDKPVTAASLRESKASGVPVVAVTAYDYPTARAMDEAGVDLLLVGDSLATVVLGHPNTLSVTMDEMLHHTRAVARAARRAMVVADMPFMSYQAEVGEAVRNAGRFLKEAGAAGVKLEGARPGQLTAVRAIVEAGIPVVGHLGCQPQSVHAVGGYRVQGKRPDDARRILQEAHELETAGVCALVLELVPDSLAAEVGAAIAVPTIGIGAGTACDGQIQVFHDLVGLTVGHLPRHASTYASVYRNLVEAGTAYARDVRHGAFAPGSHVSYLVDPREGQILAPGARGVPVPLPRSGDVTKE